MYESIIFLKNTLKIFMVIYQAEYISIAPQECSEEQGSKNKFCYLLVEH